MKRLLLLRHTKSSWDGDVPDIDRPLNARGERAAHLMGVYIRQAGFAPDMILCSTARRTRQTTALLLAALGEEIPVDHHDRLYLAAAEDIIAVLQATSDTINTVMVVGHNPGIEEVALILSHDDTVARHDIVTKFPTGGLAVIDFKAKAWATIKTGQLVDFKVPKTLV